MVASYKSFDHADSHQILLYRRIHAVILIQHPLKTRICLHCNYRQCTAKNRYCHQKNQGKLRVDANRHNNCADKHQRPADHPADDICKRVLSIRHIGGQAGNQRRGGKTVHIGKRKVLDFVKKLFTNIFGKTGTGHSGKMAAARAKAQRNHGHQYHQQAHYIKELLDR